MATLRNTTINDTGFLTIPRGTTAQRPASPALGDFRYNTQESKFEVYNGTDWLFIGTASSALYAFTTATFTPGGQTGQAGPSLAQARAGLSGSGTDAWKNNTAFFNTSNGIQLWTVPETATYRILAQGASGGPGTRTQGYAAILQGDFALVGGEIIRIVVGQQGTQSSGAGSGGGGTYVVRQPYNTNGSILIIAGGGGGSPGSCCGGQAPGGNASTGNNGTAAVQPGGVQISAGGSGGNGGGQSFGSESGGGGGFFSNGFSGQSAGGQAFINGSNGGSGSAPGSFGGGGGIQTDQAGGGGGGYSGGGNSNGGSQWGGGGGGGSFNNGTGQSSSILNNPSIGSVVITKL
jgi:hypothetical protein